MKNLLFLAVLLVGISSCTRDMVELDVIEEPNIEDANLLEGLDSRPTWPMGAYDLVDFMNARNYRDSKYSGCNKNLITLSFSGDNSTEVEHPYGPLTSRSQEEVNTLSDHETIMQNLWQKVRAECADAVIVDVEFRVGSFTTEGNYNYFIDAFTTICCVPILKEVEIPGPDVVHVKGL